MRPILCPPDSSVEPRFHEAYNDFFATGQVASDFAEHVLDHPLREDELVHAIKGLVMEVGRAGYPGLGQSLLMALPPKHRELGIKPGTPEYEKFKRGKAHGEEWKPTLDLVSLGAAIAEVRQQFPSESPATSASCSNCHEPFSPSSNAGRCLRCGNHLGSDGQVIRVGSL